MERLEKKEILDLKQELQKRLNLRLKELEEDLKKSIKEDLEEKFEDFVYCFSRWLKKRFSEGSVKT
ncbi:MAG: hypothetical protein Q9M89_00600 [Persephonella sp.]|nr:hypothetical protein [Persephonella sp.]